MPSTFTVYRWQRRALFLAPVVSGVILVFLCVCAVDRREIVTRYWPLRMSTLDITFLEDDWRCHWTNSGLWLPAAMDGWLFDIWKRLYVSDALLCPCCRIPVCHCSCLDSTSEMTYIVSGGSLNSTHSLTHSCLDPPGWCDPFTTLEICYLSVLTSCAQMHKIPLTFLNSTMDP